WHLDCGFVHGQKALRRSLSDIKGAALKSTTIPKGYLAVHVGVDQKKHYVLPLSYLNKPAFQELLNMAEEEFGYDHVMGGLTIPCREDIFIDHFSVQRIVNRVALTYIGRKSKYKRVAKYIHTFSSIGKMTTQESCKM
ncbi:Small auxin-up RNA, partial [Parasponia andersonii]